MRGAPCSSASISLGRNAGSFWPSPSSVTMIGARAAAHPGAQRRRLPAGARVANLAKPGMLRLQPRQLGLGAVGRAVVDIDDLERPAGQRRRDLGHQRRNVFGLVPHRNDDRDGRDRWRFRRSCRLLGRVQAAGNCFDDAPARSARASPAPNHRTRPQIRAGGRRTSCAPGTAPAAPTIAPAITSLG